MSVCAGPLWSTVRTGAAFWGTEPAGVCATSLRGHQATKCTIFQLQSRRTRAAQHLGASSCSSSTTTASGDPPTARALPAAARSHRGYVLRTAQRQYQCSRRCRTLQKSTPRCAMAAGIEAARTFFICACLRARCCPRLTNLYFLCGSSPATYWQRLPAWRPSWTTPSTCRSRRCAEHGGRAPPAPTAAVRGWRTVVCVQRLYGRAGAACGQLGRSLEPRCVTGGRTDHPGRSARLLRVLDSVLSFRPHRGSTLPQCVTVLTHGRITGFLTRSQADNCLRGLCPDREPFFGRGCATARLLSVFLAVMADGLPSRTRHRGHLTGRTARGRNARPSFDDVWQRGNFALAPLYAVPPPRRRLPPRSPPR